MPTEPVSFRAATPADDAWLLGKLPADRGRGVAFVGERLGLPVATFAVAPPVERYEPEGLALAFSVERQPDARAIAGQIVVLARRLAAGSKLGPLHAWPSPAEGSPGDRAYRALGFVPFDRIVTWECDAARARDTLLPMAEQARAWDTADDCWRAEDVALADADPDAVIACYEANLARLGPTRDAFARRLRGEGPNAFHPIRSRVLRLDGQVVAMMLMIFDPAVTFVAARIVAQSLRDGAANLRLFVAANAAMGIPPGCRLRFETHDRHRGTVSLARRLDAVTTETRVKLRAD